MQKYHSISIAANYKKRTNICKYPRNEEWFPFVQNQDCVSVNGTSVWLSIQVRHSSGRSY